MAFFSFDSRIQALIIAGALAGCGGHTDLDGGTDGRDDAADLADTSGDVGRDDLPHIDVDPLPDVLDTTIVDTMDADVAGVCSDPSTWAVAFREISTGYPLSTFGVTLNVPPSGITSSAATFTAEKKVIEAVRRISDTEYEVDYRWEGAITWSDWDRIHASWQVRCEDDAGTYEDTLEDDQVVCVDTSTMWLSWSDDPDTCIMVDPPPPPVAPDVEPPAHGAAPADPVDLLPRARLSTRLRSVPLDGGGVRIGVAARGPGAAASRFAWSASAGRIEGGGNVVTWWPPAEPGMHTVVVATRLGPALSVDVLKIET